MPGAGCTLFEYAPILRILNEAGYEGWLVVEAGQDPRKAHPLTYATMGYRSLSELARQAGFNVIESKEPVVPS